MDVPKTTKMSFGGPRGVLLNIVLSNFLLLLSLVMLNKEGWNFRIPNIPTSWNDYFELQATGIYIGFICCHLVFSLLPFGNIVEGQPLRNGKRLTYRCNGLYALGLALVIYILAVVFRYRVTVVYDKIIPVAMTGLILSFILGILVYLKAKTAAKSDLSPKGNTGIMIYDFFVGHELNPRIGDFDLKFFSFGLTLQMWIMLNVVYLTKAWEDLHTVPPALAIVSLSQIFYVTDNLYHESNLLTMGDIMHDGFGFFSLNGFYAFCPFMYTLQPRFLLENPDHVLPWYCLVAVLFMSVFGHVLYRGSNSQKNEFRQNPKSPAVAHLKTIPTESGRGLLVSGWWGICRKPNYLGDIIMAISWSLACGFNYIMPYFYPVFLTMLLLDRERMDNGHCQQKYKKTWDIYCQEVKYRIFPYIY